MHQFQLPVFRQPIHLLLGNLASDLRAHSVLLAGLKEWNAALKTFLKFSTRGKFYRMKKAPFLISEECLFDLPESDSYSIGVKLV